MLWVISQSGKLVSFMLNHNFWILLGNRVFTRIAYHMTTFALIIWVFEITGVNIAVSLWMVVFFAASFLSSLVAGVAADLYDRKKLMVFSNFAWGLTAFAFLAVERSFAGILFVSFFAQALDEFFNPSQNAALPQLVKAKDLIKANSVFSIFSYGANFLGYFLSGIMLRFIGYPAPFITAGVLVVLGGLFALLLPPLTHDGEKHPPIRDVMKLVKEKLADQLVFFSINKNVTSTLILMAVIASAGAAAGALAPGFAEQVLGIDSTDLSFIGILPLGVGLLLGAYILNKNEKFLAVWKGMFGFGAAVFTLAFIPNLRVLFANNVVSPQAFENIPVFSLSIAFLVFFLGFFGSVITIPIVTSLQRITPGKNLGRTFAALATIASVLTAVLSLLFGAIADLVTPALPVAIVGASAVVVSLWARNKVVIK